MCYINMAAPTSLRSISKLSRFSRKLLFNNNLSQKRHGLYSFSTVTENKQAADKPESSQEPESKEKEAQVPSGPTELEEKLTKENEKLQGDLKEMKEKYMRALAETENVRKRMKKQVDETKVFGIQGFCKDLLEVADILNQAMDSVPKDELDKNVHLKSLFEGLTMTNKQMVKVFGKHGLTKIEPRVGDKFDPFCHEALFQVPVQGDNKPGCIADVQKSGYQLHDRTVRPAIVGVFKS
ncbi:grpE protein homolog 1, mitochondrial-like [Ruditapes philippinarum]|uniref:grpE protein homolog 1, mitochondrial-like n=1 Tax=Ruditapes philippinarum TaxID=129788 RepID=UPI00295B179D|nr:grpE protein homolog 1, mitochondrial-like [Ruditapes philippinarum]